MTKPNENLENENSLYSWATGKLAGAAIGLAVGIFIYKAGVIQKLTGKLFKFGEKSQETTERKEY